MIHQAHQMRWSPDFMSMSRTDQALIELCTGRIATLERITNQGD